MLCVSIVGQELVRQLQFTHNLPMSLALLLSPDTAVRKAALKRFERIWEWLLLAEQRARTHPAWADMLRELQWPTWIWVREQLLLLREFKFQAVPPEVAKSVRAFLVGPFSSVLCEDR